MKPFLIGVGAQAGNGKNCVADYLIGRLNRVTDEMWYLGSFANNVKRIFCETFGVDMDFIEKWKRNPEPPPGFKMNVRSGLTFIGDGFRDIKENIWIDLLLKDNDKNLCVSDLRYINECKVIRENNGITILLWRPGHENTIPNRSEQELMKFVGELRNQPDGLIINQDIPFDFWIKNDGSLKDLYEKIDNIIVPFVSKKICQYPTL